MLTSHTQSGRLAKMPLLWQRGVSEARGRKQKRKRKAQLMHMKQWCVHQSICYAFWCINILRLCAVNKLIQMPAVREKFKKDLMFQVNSLACASRHKTQWMSSKVPNIFSCTPGDSWTLAIAKKSEQDGETKTISSGVKWTREEQKWHNHMGGICWWDICWAMTSSSQKQLSVDQGHDSGLLQLLSHD